MKYKKELGCLFPPLGFTLTQTKSWRVKLVNVGEDDDVAGFVARWLADVSYFETEQCDEEQGIQQSLLSSALAKGARSGAVVSVKQHWAGLTRVAGAPENSGREESAC